MVCDTSEMGLEVADAGWGNVQELTEVTSELPNGSPIDFALGKLAGQIANGDYEIVGHCNRFKFKLIAKCLDHDHVTAGVLEQPEHMDPSVPVVQWWLPSGHFKRCKAGEAKNFSKDSCKQEAVK